MLLPSGWPKRPLRFESYFTQGGGGGELVAQEGGMKVQEWRGFFFLNHYLLLLKRSNCLVLKVGKMYCGRAADI